MTRDDQVELSVYKLDLHIHTVLSPCTDLAEMTPAAIVEKAEQQRLDMIGICDHNSARNAAAVMRAAAKTRLTVIAGLEISSAEEVHILGLFPSADAALEMQDEVYGRLPGENDEEAFGYQVVVDEHDMVEDMDQRLLIGATTLSAARVVDLVHDLGGLAVASHVDKGTFSVFSQLGFIPPDLKLDALEISARTDWNRARARFSQCKDFALVRSSDAHALDQIGRVFTRARMASPEFDELRQALSGVNGRQILEEEC